MKGIEKNKLKGMRDQKTGHRTDTFVTLVENAMILLFIVFFSVAMVLLLLQGVKSFSPSKEQTTQSTTLAPQLPTDQ